MHPSLETPGVGVSEGQESSAVMGGSGIDTPLCIRVGAAHGEGYALSPSQSHGGCLSQSYFGFILMEQGVSGSERHEDGGGLSEATVPTICQQHLIAPPGKDPYFLQQKKRGGSWQSSSPGISLALSMG